MGRLLAAGGMSVRGGSLSEHLRAVIQQHSPGLMAPPPAAAAANAAAAQQRVAAAGTAAAAAAQSLPPLHADGAWSWLSETTFTHLRNALGRVMTTNTLLHAASVNRRLAADAARVLSDELLLAGAPRITPRAWRYAALGAVSALLDPSDLIWQPGAWAPGGGILPSFERGLSAAERGAIAAWRAYLQGIRSDLERPDRRAVARQEADQQQRQASGRSSRAATRDAEGEWFQGGPFWVGRCCYQPSAA